jgi:hypothetical protein
MTLAFAGVDALVIARLYKAVFDKRLEIGGAGVYDEFVHVDVRGGSLHTWDERTRK